MSFTKDDISRIDFKKYSDELVPTIIQDASSGRVLMLGFSTPLSLEKSLKDKKATFYSRSKKALWQKGETSGHTLELQDIQYDCDNDTILFLVTPNGPTCHTGEKSCFFEGGTMRTDAQVFWEVFDTIAERMKNPQEGSYVNHLFDRGLDRIAQKVGEEGVETVIAAKNDDREDFIGEASDLLFHLMVLLQAKKVSLNDIAKKFEEREKKT